MSLCVGRTLNPTRGVTDDTYKSSGPCLCVYTFVCVPLAWPKTETAGDGPPWDVDGDEYHDDGPGGKEPLGKETEGECPETRSPTALPESTRFPPEPTGHHTRPTSVRLYQGLLTLGARDEGGGTG